MIVPAFNERATLSTIMDQVLEKSIDGMEIEVVLVESNSTDGTRKEAQRYGHHPRVRLHPPGWAEREGVGRPRRIYGDVVLIQDADLEFSVDDYDDLVAPLMVYRRNFIIGSRHVAKGQVWKIRQFNDSAPLAAVFNLGHVIFLTLFNVITVSACVTRSACSRCSGAIASMG